MRIAIGIPVSMGKIMNEDIPMINLSWDGWLLRQLRIRSYDTIKETHFCFCLQFIDAHGSRRIWRDFFWWTIFPAVAGGAAIVFFSFFFVKKKFAKKLFTSILIKGERNVLTFPSSLFPAFLKKNKKRISHENNWKWED